MVQEELKESRYPDLFKAIRSSGGPQPAKFGAQREGEGGGRGGLLYRRIKGLVSIKGGGTPGQVGKRKGRLNDRTLKTSLPLEEGERKSTVHHPERTAAQLVKRHGKRGLKELSQATSPQDFMRATVLGWRNRGQGKRNCVEEFNGKREMMSRLCRINGSLHRQPKIRTPGRQRGRLTPTRKNTTAP